MGRFDGLTVLVTGAAGGFGRRTAERFALEGARLVLSDQDAGALAELEGAHDAETAGGAPTPDSASAARRGSLWR